MPLNLNIAIVSDLHIGDRAREYDLVPSGTPPYDGYLGYLDYMERLIEEQQLKADVLVVSGDVTDRAQPSQFEHAAKVIQRLATLLSVPDNQIVAVPGNHDLNWDVANLAKKEPFWLDYKFSPFVEGFSKTGCDVAALRQLVEPPHFAMHSRSDADIWCFNSAAYDLPELAPHRGEIREHQRNELEARLAALYDNKEKDRFRIFVTHHHPKPQPDLYLGEPDFSGMVNGEILIDLLAKYRFDIIMHGHKHRPWCRSFIENGGDPIVVWCSGSYSHQLGPQYYGTIGNLWHMAELHGTSPDGHCFGVVKSWAFAPSQGWKPSRPSFHGIDHLTPFGPITDRSSVKRQIAVELTAAWEVGQVVTWESIRGKSMLLSYQAGPIVWSILRELSRDQDFKIHGEADSLDGLLLWRTPA